MSALDGKLDAIALSVLASGLSGIAEEMGAVLVRGAYSSNIKERRDLSTALFDHRGRMIAQAEHMPVHLGAMPEAVAAVAAKDPGPGDVFIINDPFSGGTHLPDITLVAPVEVDGERLGFTVTRAHHSDVGGKTPGSMPASSRSIYEEGLVIPPMRLLREGAYVEDVLALLLANVRTPEIRLGDLRAQVGANHLGEACLRELAERHGVQELKAAFDEVIAYTERRTRDAIRALPDGVYRASGEIEGDGVTADDIPLEVSVAIEGDEMTVDFAGTAGRVAGNINCPIAVTRAACYFALHVVLPRDVPLNGGTFLPLTIRTQRPSLVDAEAPAAVVAGNVETSQRIADTLMLALGKAVELHAQGQGTMNNLIIGCDAWTYYETVGGGQGASSAGPGPSGVHVGMSNALNTPIEALELEFPMRVQRYELARGSGGDGVHRGGDGIVRVVQVLEPCTLSLITDRRRHRPRGAAGGGDGEAGRNLLNGEPLPAKATRQMRPGDAVTVQTPGGGGWGTASAGAITR